MTEYDITISESSILAKYNSFQVQIFLYRAKSKFFLLKNSENQKKNSKIFFHLILASGEGNHFPSDESYQLNNWILAEINRVKAFPIEKLNLVPICRILRFLSKKNSLLNGLTSQWIDVLVCKSFESARWPLTVGDGLRRVFGVISSGKGFKKKFSLKYNSESPSLNSKIFIFSKILFRADVPPSNLGGYFFKW